MTVFTQELIFGLVGGLGLFLFGLFLMGQGFQKIAGDRIRRFLENKESVAGGRDGNPADRGSSGWRGRCCFGGQSPQFRTDSFKTGFMHAVRH